MAIVVNTKTYDADLAVNPNQLPYLGPNNSLSTKDRVDLYRTLPKSTATFSGVGRSRVKLVRTLTLTGAKTSSSDAIGSADFSFPVGAADADIETFMTDFGALVSAAWTKNLAKKLDITV